MVGKSLGLLLMACVASSCGGAAAGPGPETGGENEPAGSEPTEAPASSDAPATEGATEGTPAEEATETSGGGSVEATTALEGSDLEAVLQIILKDPELLDHLYLKKPGRAPLKVAGAGLPAKLKVVVGSHDVKVVDEPKSKKDPVLVFTKLEREGEQARVHYRFDVESLKGRATVYLKNGRWELGANRVIEK